MHEQKKEPLTTLRLRKTKIKDHDYVVIRKKKKIQTKLKGSKMNDNRDIGKSKIEVTGSRNSGKQLNILQYSYAHVVNKE